MPLPALASLGQLEARLGGDVDDVPQALAMLDQASAIVRAYTGLRWVDEHGNLDGVPDGVPGVVVEMVYRVTQNPGGATQDTAGPFSVAFGANAAERLYLSVGDKLILDAVPGRRSGLGVISTTRGPVETPPVGGPAPLDGWL